MHLRALLHSYVRTRLFTTSFLSNCNFKTHTRLNIEAKHSTVMSAETKSWMRETWNVKGDPGAAQQEPSLLMAPMSQCPGGEFRTSSYFRRELFFSSFRWMPQTMSPLTRWILIEICGRIGKGAGSSVWGKKWGNGHFLFESGEGADRELVSTPYKKIDVPARASSVYGCAFECKFFA